jgi:hypothetical protein
MFVGELPGSSRHGCDSFPGRKRWVRGGHGNVFKMLPSDSTWGSEFDLARWRVGLWALA